eukprot:Skav223212  [mRNA]  locus=scaffold2231:15455:19525:- [translate_table: standard]
MTIPTAEGFCIRFPNAQGGWHDIPIGKETTYLGVVISYHASSNRTLEHRIHLSKCAFARLRTWLTSRHLSMTTRYRLWTTCVWPVLFYGLGASNITDQGLQKLQKHMYVQLRQVCRNHSYITGDTHRTALRANGCEEPLSILRHSLHRLHECVLHRQSIASSDDILHTINWDHLPPLLAHIDHHILTSSGALISGDPLSEPETSPLLSCNLCSFQTYSLPNFRRHRTQVHGRPLLRTTALDIQQHTAEGLPTCQRCFHSFSSWHTFRTHVESHACQPWQVPSIQQPMQVAQDIADGLLRNSRLRIQDLAFLNGLEAGQRFLRHIIAKDWQGLADDRPACQLAQTRCCLCGAFQSRMQALSKHLKQLHRHRYEGITAFAAQLGEQYGQSGYCPYCAVPWVSRHTCPVLIQASVFHLHGAPTQSDDGGPLQPLACLHCQETFAQAQDLHDHIQRHHRSRCYPWDPRRDALHSDCLACGHCGAQFSDPNGTKQHIVNGRCPQYTPHGQLPPHPKEMEWLTQLKLGTFGDYIVDDTHRHLWTYTCLQCNTGYSRTQDLMAHVQLAHADQWAAARPYLAFNMTTLGSDLGCVCYHPIKQARSAHMCVPFVQAAVLQAQHREMLLLPFDIESDDWYFCWRPHVPDALQLALRKVLQTRDFCRFWLDGALLEQMRVACLLCETTADQPALLHSHLMEAHMHQHSGTAALLDILTDMLGTTMHHAHQCPFCNSVFALPDTDPEILAPLARAHLRAQCPNLLQTAILLTAPYGGGPSGTSGLQHPVSDSPRPAVVPANSPPSRASRDARQRPSTKRGRTGPDTSQEEQRSNQFPRTLGHYFNAAAEDHSTIDLLGDEDGQGSQPSAPSRSVCPLSQQGPTGHPGSTSPISNPVALQGRDATTCAASAVPLDIADDERTPGSHGEAVEPVPHFRHGQEPPEAGSLVAMRGLAIPEVVSAEAIHDPGLQETLSHEGCDPDPDRDRRAPDGDFDGTEVPSSPHINGVPGCAMAPPTEPSAERRLETVHGPEPERSLDSGRCALQAAPPATEPPTSDLAADGLSSNQGEGEGQIQIEAELQRRSLRPSQADLINWMQRVRFTNTDSNCYVNATMAAWLWAHLCLQEWRPFFLGESCNQLLAELGGLGPTFNWATSSWLSPLLRRSGLLGQQQDAAELTQMLLGFTSATHLTQQWEKRSDASGIQVHEGFYHLDLLRLSFPDDPFARQEVTLTNLIEHWAQQGLTRNALLQEPGLMCVHISRFTQPHDHRLFRIRQTVQHSLGVHVPFFPSPETLDRDWQDSEVIAMISHLGQTSASGHYRAALRCFKGHQQHLWLLLEDNQPPELMVNLPRWFQEQVTVMWLCPPRLLR